MDRVEEIEAAITDLPPEDFRRIAQWFRALEQTRWDEQLDLDSSACKLDFLFEEADSESVRGVLREWPPSRRAPSCYWKANRGHHHLGLDRLT